MTSIFYWGILVGSLITGKVSDTYGRKPVIITGSSVQFASCVLFGFVDSYSTMLIVRFIYGFAFGVTVALTTSMFS
mgnify:CR=1 FL=1